MTEYTPDNCPHLWEEVSTSQGKKHVICVLCGVNKFLLEAIDPRRKAIRVRSSTQHRVIVKLSTRARENLKTAAADRGVTRSEVVEKILFSLTSKQSATPAEGQLLQGVYVVEKLVFNEWEPFDCALSKEAADHILATCGAEGRLRVMEYVPSKPLKYLVRALKDALNGEMNAKKMSSLRGAYSGAKGMLGKKLE